jgi:hypothetical protein
LKTTLEIRKIEDVFESNTPSIAQITKEFSSEVTHAVMVKIISEAASFFSVGMGMDTPKLNETARLIIKEFYFLTTADFKLFFDNLKSGKYGEAFNRMDGNVIMVNLRKFLAERTQVAEALALEAHKKQEEKEGEEQKEIYLIKCGDYYVRKTDEGLEEVSSKDIATPFEFKVAYKLVSQIQKHHYPDGKTKVCMVDKRKSDIMLLDVIKKEAPGLLTDSQRYHLATDDYFKKKKEIENSSLSDLDKANAIRQLSGLEPLSFEEYKKDLKVKYRRGDIGRGK